MPFVIYNGGQHNVNLSIKKGSSPELEGKISSPKYPHLCTLSIGYFVFLYFVKVKSKATELLKRDSTLGQNGHISNRNDILERTTMSRVIDNVSLLWRRVI